MATQKTEVLRGKEHIQQLIEAFPEMSRQRVIAADYRVEGIRHTAILDQIGRWAMPDAHDHYEYDYEEHAQGDLVDGVTRTPKKMYFGEVKDLQIMFDSHSPYEVRYEGGGRYWLYRDRDPIEEVYFVPCPQWFWKKTSSGRPMNQVVMTNFERRYMTYVTDYCEYFKDGNQCRFCNLNSTGDHFAELGRQRAPVKREQDVYETFLAFVQETKLEGVGLIGGSFYDRKKEADLYLRNIGVLKRAMRDSGIGCETLNVTSQALEAEDQLRFKEAGVTSVSFHLEVWDPRLFPVICPGKARNVGREHWIELLFKGVEIFGWGKVESVFVLGVEMAPTYGDKTEEEEAESVGEGIRLMASHGVSPRLQLFRGNPGSMLARAPRPRIEHCLRMEREIIKAMQKYSIGPRRG